jgi:hypothetical protein
VHVMAGCWRSVTLPGACLLSEGFEADRAGQQQSLR